MISSLSAKVNTQAFMLGWPLYRMTWQTVWCDKMNWLNTPLNNWFHVSFIIQIINYKWFNRQIYGWFVRIEATCKNAKCVTLHALELLYCWQSASPTLVHNCHTPTDCHLSAIEHDLIYLFPHVLMSYLFQPFILNGWTLPGAVRHYETHADFAMLN